MAHRGRKNADHVLAMGLASGQTLKEAAAGAGVSERTASRRGADPEFRQRVEQARRQMRRSAIERLQSAVGEAVDTLRIIARSGTKESDRIRAAALLLDHAFRGIEAPPDAPRPPGTLAVQGTADVVRVLADRLTQIDEGDLPTPEKARLTATLADAMLRAIGVDVLDKRMEALHAVLIGRKEKSR